MKRRTYRPAAAGHAVGARRHRYDRKRHALSDLVLRERYAASLNPTQAAVVRIAGIAGMPPA